MAAIPLFTPSQKSRASPRNSLGVSPGFRAQDSPRLKKKTPGSSRRKSFARKLLESPPHRQDEDESEVPSIGQGVRDSMQLEQDEVASASTPRATPKSAGAGSSKNPASAASTPGNQTGTADVKRASVITDGDAGLREPETDDEEYGFKRFIGHRWVGDSIEIHVEWDSSETTWEPETNLHEDAPEALFEYWREQGGRPKNPIDPEIYEVFAILKHNKNRSRLLVEWVGFERSEASWASRKIIEETAKDIVDAYFDSLKPTKEKK
nr:chromo domain containing protein [Trichoderma decipiens]